MPLSAFMDGSFRDGSPDHRSSRATAMKKLQFHLTPSLFGPIFGRMPGVKDRVAVVTGAANGLGREIALLLAREGARVALGDLDGAELERTAAAITKAGASSRSSPMGSSHASARTSDRLGQPIEVAHAVLFL